MLLGARQFLERRGAPTPPLPYDAEVEYLESVGTQWIDTGIKLSSAIILQSRFAFSSSTLQQYIPFAYYIRRGQQYGLAVQDGNIVAALMSGFTIGCSADVLDWHDIQFNMSGGYPTLHFDGVHVATATNEYVSTGGNTICLYAFKRSQNAPQLGYLGAGKIASFSIADASTGQKIQDLIPVRKNGVGYMYDKVSGNLLGNSGTGDFVIGPDKTANLNGGGV